MGKKKGGGKPKKNYEPTPEEIAAMEEQKVRDELDNQLLDLVFTLKQEQDDFNEYQQQREKLNYFWIVEKKNLEDKKSDVRNKIREQQDLEEKHGVEIKVYKQRVKHLLYEHQNEVTQFKTESETTLKLLEDEHRADISELKKDKRSLHIDLKEMELAQEDFLKSLKQQQDHATTELRQEFERKARELQLQYDKKMKRVRTQLDARRRADIVRIEQQKDRHIKELMKGHEQAFAEIKNYYTDITHNNLDLIKSLKEEVGQMKKDELADEKKMYEISLENKRMSEPLKRALTDVEKLREELNDYQRDKSELDRTKAEILIYEQSIRGLEWETEVLTQRFEKVQVDRDGLYTQFQDVIYDVQQKSGFKNLLLERRMEALRKAMEKKDGELNEVLASANLSPNVVGKLNRNMEDILEVKNQTIRDVQQELERITQLHNDAVRSYEAKLSEYGIPIEELGFVPRLEPLPRKNVVW